MEEKSERKVVQVLGRDMIVVGFDLLSFIVADIVGSTPCTHTYVIVTDTQLARLGHLETFMDQWNKEKRLVSIVILSGEESKCYGEKERVERRMIEEGCGRDSALIGLGGGVVGDLVGFIASTFMRGIPLFHIPTTLLAMVDSAIGGKNSINLLPQGKNLIGTFYQPMRIYVDLAYLRTLPRREVSNGMAEIIKAAAIVGNPTEFHRLECQSSEFWEQVRKANGGCEELLQTVLHAIEFKARIVSEDEREGGKRELLNFGHTVGHGIEGLMAPSLLHGECVAIGMCAETEISINLSISSPHTLQRLQHVLGLYDLPTALTQHLDLNKFMDCVGADKKGRGGVKRVVLLTAIGQTLDQSATPVGDQDILRVVAPALAIQRSLSTPPTQFSLAVPGSKSISNRALLLAALGQGPCDLDGLLHSEDTHWMTLALQKITNRTFTFLPGSGNVLRVGGATQGVEFTKGHHEIYLGNCGTAARFLTSLCVVAARHSGFPITLTGNKRMKERPIGPLVNALRANGAQIDYVGKEGCLPLLIHPTQEGLRGGELKVSAQLSSQYVSSLLMAAPLAATQQVTLVLAGDKVPSQPYIDITTSVMASFGIQVNRLNETTYVIPKKSYVNPATYVVEGDASSATYPLAVAAITGSTCTVTNLGSRSLQGDAHFAKKVLEPMGCAVEVREEWTRVKGPPIGALKGIPSIDMDSMTDAFLTASVLGAVAEGVTQIVGVANARVKECDRIAVAVAQLKGFGVNAWELPDGIAIQGIDPRALTPAQVDCWDDHRIAMAFSVLATLAPGTIITDKHCVVKSWPGWWNALISTLAIPTEGIATPQQQPPTKTLPKGSSKTSVVLIGMKKGGKSTVGKDVARRLSMGFVDLDELIVEKEGVEIKGLVEKQGWEEFRRIEAQLLVQVLQEHPSDWLIATGGGVIETEANRNELKKWMKKGGMVVHVDSDWETLDKEFSQDAHSFIPYPNNESFLSVVARRQEFYEECSNYLFLNDRRGTMGQSVSQLQRLIQFGRGLLPSPLPPLTSKGQPRSRSFFLCLAMESMSSIKNEIGRMANGCHAIEIRVDHLKHEKFEFGGSFEKRVAEEVGVVEREGEGRALIYTVRTQSEGGLIPDSIDPSHLTSLYQLGLRLGCPFIDVQTRTRHLFDGLDRGGSKVIASFHGAIAWREPSAHLILNQCLAYGDVVKMIGVGEDNEGCRGFVESYYSSSPSVPLIAFNMGMGGGLSRMRNGYLTPVTHPLSPPSAPGQLTLQQIHQGLTLLGQIQPKSYFIFGHFISYSKSPLIHNTLFASLGLPHTYAICDTHELAEVKRVMDRPSFGGASVTVPHKEAILPLVGSLSEAGRVIGAINTITRDPRTGVLCGDNTDWIGIKLNIQRALHGQAQGEGGGALVLGAGGTARAAIFALHKLNFHPIYVWNRSEWRLDELVEGMKKNKMNIKKTAKELGELSGRIGLIVDTTPAHAHSAPPSLLSAIFPSQQKGIVVRLGYDGQSTANLTHNIEQPNLTHVSPIDILIDQGIAQSTIWTQLKPSRQIVVDALNKL